MPFGTRFIAGPLCFIKEFVKMSNKKTYKELVLRTTCFLKTSSCIMKQLFVLIGFIFASNFCLSQNLDSVDQNLLKTLFDLEIGSDPELLTSYFFELDLASEPMTPDQHTIMFYDTFAGLDSVRYEFNYLNKQLISYGISKRGLGQIESEELQKTIVAFLEYYGDLKMKVNEETLMDGHGSQLAKSFFLELGTTHFGVSC